jgi:hypothetical protein
LQKNDTHIRVTVIRIDVHPVGETRPTRYTHFTLSPCKVPDHMYLMWSTHSNLSRSPHEVKAGPYTRKKSWQPKQTGPTVILGHLTLPPSRRPWSRGERFQPSGYTATSAYWAHIPACTRYVQYLLTEVNPAVLNWHRRGATILEVSAFHNTLPDLSNRWSSAFHLRAPLNLRLSNLNISL